MLKKEKFVHRYDARPQRRSIARSDVTIFTHCAFNVDEFPKSDGSGDRKRSDSRQFFRLSRDRDRNKKEAFAAEVTDSTTSAAKTIEARTIDLFLRNNGKNRAGNCRLRMRTFEFLSKQYIFHNTNSRLKTGKTYYSLIC